MTLKEVGRDVEELGSEDLLTAFLCFLGAGAGEMARSLPFPLEKRERVSESERDLTLGATALTFADFGDSAANLTFFLTLGLSATEGAEREDMIERKCRAEADVAC